MADGIPSPGVLLQALQSHFVADANVTLGAIVTPCR